MRLVLISSPSTVVQPLNIKHLNSKQSTELGEGVKVCQVEDRQIILEGDFTGFHAYMIATHTRFTVSPSSVGLTTNQSFRAQINMKLEPDVPTSQIGNFISPLIPLHYVRAVKLGRDFDGFELGLPGARSERFPCDLPFMISRRVPIPPASAHSPEYPVHRYGCRQR
jgi:hypothetical protein